MRLADNTVCTPSVVPAASHVSNQPLESTIVLTSFHAVIYFRRHACILSKFATWFMSLVSVLLTADDEFQALCFQYGVELDDVVGATSIRCRALTSYCTVSHALLSLWLIMAKCRAPAADCHLHRDNSIKRLRADDRESAIAEGDCRSKGWWYSYRHCGQRRSPLQN
jgi:hypothetical protein